MNLKSHSGKTYVSVSGKWFRCPLEKQKDNLIYHKNKTKDRGSALNRKRSAAMPSLEHICIEKTTLTHKVEC